MTLFKIPGLTLDTSNIHFYTFGNKVNEEQQKKVILFQAIKRSNFYFLVIFSKSASIKEFIFN